MSHSLASKDVTKDDHEFLVLLPPLPTCATVPSLFDAVNETQDSLHAWQALYQPSYTPGLAVTMVSPYLDDEPEVTSSSREA